jgi:hypothetical protein
MADNVVTVEWGYWYWDECQQRWIWLALYGGRTCAEAY